MIIVGVHTNWIQLLWAMMAAASLTLGIVHLVVWFKQRSHHANLTFFALASAVAVFSGFELAIVGAQTPAEHALWLRWAHVPIAAIVVLIVVFVRLYFGVGRLWLAWAAVGFRLLTVLLNFTTGVNVNFQEVTGLQHSRFLGELVSSPIGTLNAWQIVAQIANLLLVAFVVDASVTLWRRGDPVSRRRATVVGGGILACVVLVVGFAVLILSGAVRAPTIMTPGFFIVVVAMGYELSWDLFAAQRTAAQLRRSEAELQASGERFRAVVEAAPNAMLLVDAQGADFACERTGGVPVRPEPGRSGRKHCRTTGPRKGAFVARGLSPRLRRRVATACHGLGPRHARAAQRRQRGARRGLSDADARCRAVDGAGLAHRHLRAASE